MLFIFALSWPFSWKLPIWMLNAGSIDILFLIFPFLSPSHRFNPLLRHFYLLPYSGCVLHAFYSVTTNETSILFETKCRKHCCSRSLSLSSSHRFAHMFESLRGGQDENILCRMHYEWMKALKGLHTYERLFNLSLSLWCGLGAFICRANDFRCVLCFSSSIESFFHFVSCTAQWFVLLLLLLL